MKIDFHGKMVLVTGGSGGIGRVIVRTLAECGADVAIHYHSNQTKAEELVKELEESYGVKAAAFQADLTKEEEVHRIKKEMEESFGMPELLVVNAVIQYPFKPLLDQEISDFYSQFESCVMQMVYLCKAFIPYMQKQKYGRIVAINTECSYMAEPTFSAYVAAKRGLDGLVRVLAKEVGKDNITVNEVAPGWTITDKIRGSNEGEPEDYIKTVPLNRRGDDQDIANMVAFFLSDYASFTTGAYIPVSGGRVMPGI